ncbi:hypothetical protein H4R26_000341 [Coemansia thaxteri]|uniref:AAA-ATPase-like domain-containing protein n=1 Tax=Coemansia thaxteri TaxID=2663907 RepID=A0A9W8BMX4_9FUNG|nr:hypothetical protein H4R26_000341 [Coemansia thaxteri]
MRVVSTNDTIDSGDSGNSSGEANDSSYCSSQPTALPGSDSSADSATGTQSSDQRSWVVEISPPRVSKTLIRLETDVGQDLGHPATLDGPALPSQTSDVSEYGFQSTPSLREMPARMREHIRMSPTKVAGSRVSVGGDFGTIARRDGLIVDKTPLYVNEAACVCLPRRFGKTFNLSIVEEFFNVVAVDDVRSPSGRVDAVAGKAARFELFENSLLLTEHPEFFYAHFCKYPVICISFKGDIASSSGEFHCCLAEAMADAVKAWLSRLKKCVLDSQQRLSYESLLQHHRELMSLIGDDVDRWVTQGGRAWKSFAKLSNLLHDIFEHNYIVLLDEYDEPLSAIRAPAGGKFNPVSVGRFLLELGSRTGPVESSAQPFWRETENQRRAQQLVKDNYAVFFYLLPKLTADYDGNKAKCSVYVIGHRDQTGTRVLAEDSIGISLGVEIFRTNDIEEQNDERKKLFNGLYVGDGRSLVNEFQLIYDLLPNAANLCKEAVFTNFMRVYVIGRLHRPRYIAVDNGVSGAGAVDEPRYMSELETSLGKSDQIITFPATTRDPRPLVVVFEFKRIEPGSSNCPDTPMKRARAGLKQIVEKEYARSFGMFPRRLDIGVAIGERKVVMRQRLWERTENSEAADNAVGENTGLNIEQGSDETAGEWDERLVAADDAGWLDGLGWKTQRLDAAYRDYTS